MTLGSGARHSEQNASETEPMRFIQMWIMPERQGLEPGVEQRIFTIDDRLGNLLEVISPEGGAAVKVHGNARVFVSRLVHPESVRHELGEGRGAYLYVIEGDVSVNGNQMVTGSAARIRDESTIEISANADSELIMVDVDLSWSG